jgi:hypothetical protein
MLSGNIWWHFFCGENAIVNYSDFCAKLRLIFEGKIKIKTNGTS